ncbi:M23 family metallopeptidase [Anaerolentibacter hominis]|uniref:M23 family metallopeptidase n=1 Tax=Anaerolentibacter hominis TaxID=3079009 RepID=UPI0031B8718B
MKNQKGLYLSLILGCLMLVAVGTAFYNTQKNSLPENKLPEENISVADGSDQINETNNVNDSAYNDALFNDVELDYDVPNDPVDLAEVPKEDTKDAEPEKKAEEKKPKEEAKPDKTADVKDDNDMEAAGAFGNNINLTFNEEEGLAWPVTGNILLDYNMDSVVYFKTLNQYKCNPALLIEGRVGNPVFAAAESVVTKVENREETGLTVTTSIGNDYEVLYGQLTDIVVKEGSQIKEGDLIGYIAEPTSYYTKEGGNLWFQVMEDGKPVNPLLLLN